MASGEAEAVPDPPQSKTVVLKVFIHCPGCKKKVQRIVKRIDGVSTCEVDAPHNKVTVTGNVDADYLIKKLLKSGKQADLWPEPKNPNPNTAQKKEPHPPKETSDKSQKNPSETPKEIDTKPAKEPQKPNKSAKEEDGPKPDESKTQTQSSSEAPPAKTPASGEEAGGATGANKKEKKGQNSKPAENKREADSAAPPAPPDVRMPQMYLPPPPAPAIVSYNTAQPSTSHAYYAAAPMPHMMSQGYAAAPVPQGYAAAPMPHMMPQGYAAAPMPNMSQGYAYAPYYPAPPPQQLPLEDLYYGPPGSRLSSPPRDQYEYAVFNDENANSCTVM